jgi:hypothetical protein
MTTTVVTPDPSIGIRARRSFLPAEAVARMLFDTVNPLPNVAPSWNVTPMQSAMVVGARQTAASALGIQMARLGQQ